MQRINELAQSSSSSSLGSNDSLQHAEPDSSMTLILTNTSHLFKCTHSASETLSQLSHKCPQLHISLSQLFLKLHSQVRLASWNAETLTLAIPVKIRISDAASLTFNYDFVVQQESHEEFHRLFIEPLIRMQGVMWRGLQELSEGFMRQRDTINQYRKMSNLNIKEDKCVAKEVFGEEHDADVSHNEMVVRYLVRVQRASEEEREMMVLGEDTAEDAADARQEQQQLGFKWVPEVLTSEQRESKAKDSQQQSQGEQEKSLHPETADQQPTSAKDDPPTTAPPHTNTPMAKSTEQSTTDKTSPGYVITKHEQKRKRELDDFISNKRNQLNKNSRKMLKKKIL